MPPKANSTSTPDSALSAAVLEDIPLPSGWRARLCTAPPEHAGFVYYLHDTLGIDSWSDPRFPMPIGWIEARDAIGQSVFFKEPLPNTANSSKSKRKSSKSPKNANNDSSEPEYTGVDPRGPEIALLLRPNQLKLPGGWNVENLPNGIVYFSHSFSQSTSWTDPRHPLPAVWKQKRKENGASYFVNLVTGEERDGADDPRLDPSRRLPDGWKLRSEYRGLYYVDPTGAASWVDPTDPLPDGWNLIIDTQCRRVFTDPQGVETDQDPRLKSGLGSGFRRKTSISAPPPLAPLVEGDGDVSALNSPQFAPPKPTKIIEIEAPQSPVASNAASPKASKSLKEPPSASRSKSKSQSKSKNQSASPSDVGSPEAIASPTSPQSPKVHQTLLKAKDAKHDNSSGSVSSAFVAPASARKSATSDVKVKDLDGFDSPTGIISPVNAMSLQSPASSSSGILYYRPGGASASLASNKRQKSFQPIPVHMDERYTTRYTKVQKFSQGAFGQILEVKRKTSDQEDTNGNGNEASPSSSSSSSSSSSPRYALKLLKSTNETRRELSIHRSIACSHPYIVSMIEGFQTSTECALILQLCKGGNLHNFIEQHKYRYWVYEKTELESQSQSSSKKGKKGSNNTSGNSNSNSNGPDPSDYVSERPFYPAFYYLPESLIIQWMCEILLSVAHLHSHEIVHLDLKMANLFLEISESERLCKWNDTPQCIHCGEMEEITVVKSGSSTSRGKGQGAVASSPSSNVIYHDPQGGLVYRKANSYYRQYIDCVENYNPPAPKSVRSRTNSRPASEEKEKERGIKRVEKEKEKEKECLFPPLVSKNGMPAGSSGAANGSQAANGGGSMFPAIGKPQSTRSSAAVVHTNLKSPLTSPRGVSNASSNPFGLPALITTVPDWPHLHSIYHHYHIRLGDFGMATTVKDYRNTLKHKPKDEFEGTPATMAPEAFTNEMIKSKLSNSEISGNSVKRDRIEAESQEDCYKLDCWAVGVILYYLTCLQLPFGSVDPTQPRDQVDRQFFAVKKRVMKENPPPIPMCYSSQLRELIMSLLSKKPRFRPHLIDILNSELCQPYLEAIGARQAD